MSRLVATIEPYRSFGAELAGRRSDVRVQYGVHDVRRLAALRAEAVRRAIAVPGRESVAGSSPPTEAARSAGTACVPTRSRRRRRPPSAPVARRGAARRLGLLPLRA